MSEAYEIVEHAYDVVIVGAGGAGLRPALGTAASGLKTACIAKVFPTRSHAVAAQGGMAASLGGAHAREDFPKRDDENWLQHTLSWLDDDGRVRLDYRQAHLQPVTNEVATIPPKERVY